LEAQNRSLEDSNASMILPASPTSAELWDRLPDNATIGVSPVDGTTPCQGKSKGKGKRKGKDEDEDDADEDPSCNETVSTTPGTPSGLPNVLGMASGCLQEVGTMLVPLVIVNYIV
jgi:hypothetical protein